MSIFASLFPPGEGHFQVNQPLVVFLALCIGSYQPSSRQELAMQNNDAYHEFCLFQTKPIGSIYGVYIYINISTFTIQISHSCRYIWIRPMGIRHGDGVASLLRQEHIVDPLVRRKILLEAAVGLHGGSWMGIKLGKCKSRFFRGLILLPIVNILTFPFRL